MATKSQTSNKLTVQALARAVGASTVTIKRYADDGLIKCERVNFGAQQVRMFDPDQVVVARSIYEKSVKRSAPRA